MTNVINPKTNTLLTHRGTIDAAIDYLLRATGKVKPEGECDDEGRFYPSENEKCDCCNVITTPSITWPITLLNHCCTATHVSKKHNVDPKATRKIADFIRKNNVDITQNDSGTKVAMLLDSITKLK
jgi:hypothetical protein